jgi:hypothetical protein
VAVSFDPNPVKVGINRLTTGPNLTAVVTATVLPAGYVGSTTISVARQPRVSVTINHTDAAAGTITFTVKGLTATDPLSPNGDTTLQGRVNGFIRGEAQAIVIVPAAVGTPHPQPNGAVRPQNMCLDATTSPADPYLPPGTVQLETVYAQWLTIPVLDQFGKALDPIYNGVPVTEANVPINQAIQNGAYTDPTGKAVLAGVQPANSAVANRWPNQPAWPPVPQFGSDPGGTAVEVGGNSLSPAVVNRTTIWSTALNGTVTIRIVWP